MKTKKTEKRLIAPIVMIAVLALAAFSSVVMPACAQGNPGAGCPSTTKFYGTIHGDIYFERHGWMEKPSLTTVFDNVPEGEIKIARVYTGVWGGSPGKGGKFNITVNGVTSSTYQACDPCPGAPCKEYQHLRCDALNWSGNSPPNIPTDICHDYIAGCNVHFISYNATPYIHPGSNTITVKTCCDSCTCWDGRIYTTALLVVYEDETKPEMTYWINEGAPYMEKGSGCDGSKDHLEASFYFNGSHISDAYKMKYRVLGWPHVINTSEPSAYTKLNGNNIGYPDYTESEGGGYNEIFLRWDDIPTEYLDAGSNLMECYDPAPNYERAFAAALMVRKYVNKSDLTLTEEDIEFPNALRPNKDHIINATLTNDGDVAAESFNVSLYVNDELKNTVNVTSGLNAGDSTTVNLEVNLSRGCYEFKVVADPDNVVEEANEDNNRASTIYQVGYVVVVKSNSDFDKLVVDTGLPLNSVKKVGNTYYIQNLEIKNCVGPGIFMENTNVPFVIRNCTVRNCGENGVYFRNVANGKVNDSVVKDNSMKGIMLRNSNHMDIANNLLQNNRYGIYVSPELMTVPDCEFINITNNMIKENLHGIGLIGHHCTVCDNVIQNNTVSEPGIEEGRGIYAYGNYNKIYNNTIAYNDNYGIYMDHGVAHPCLWNCIYGNTFTGNNIQFPGHGSQAYDSGDNYWNSTVKLGYYNDSCGAACAFDNYMGNYWSDYTGLDSNNDKIGDTAYGIDGGTVKDNSPLMEQQWQDYELVLCGDVDCSGAVNMGDVYPVFRRVYGDPVCSDWAADVDCSGAVNMGDVYPVFRRVYGDPVNCCKACQQP